QCSHELAFRLQREGNDSNHRSRRATRLGLASNDAARLQRLPPYTRQGFARDRTRPGLVSTAPEELEWKNFGNLFAVRPKGANRCELRAESLASCRGLGAGLDQIAEERLHGSI